MYKKKSILGIITARGGSKGLRRKNLRVVGGKPLIVWTIEAARHSRYLDRIVLSSEDKEIISTARKWRCEVPFVRPKELSEDKTPGILPVIHAINTMPDKYDFIVLLQPTSPLRTAQDIDACIKQCISGKHHSCVSVVEPEKSPFWMFSRDREGFLVPLIKTDKMPARRQELPKVYALNGAVYVADCEWLLKSKAFVMQKTSAYEMPVDRSLDIDSRFDLLKMEAYLKYQRSNGKS